MSKYRKLIAALVIGIVACGRAQGPFPGNEALQIRYDTWLDSAGHRVLEGTVRNSTHAFTYTEILLDVTAMTATGQTRHFEVAVDTLLPGQQRRFITRFDKKYDHPEVIVGISMVRRAGQ